MNSKFPYKQLSLLFGILVAAIILGLFFVDQGGVQATEASAVSEGLYTQQIPALVKLLFEKAAYIVK